MGWIGKLRPRAAAIVGAVVAILVVLALLERQALFDPACTRIDYVEQNRERSEQNQANKKDCTPVIVASIFSTGNFIKRFKDEINALSTFIIAIFTVILGVFTISLAKSTRVAAFAAKEAADIAKDASQEATAVEAARFYIIITGNTLDEPIATARKYPKSPAMAAGGRKPIVNYCFKNYGKTPGIVGEVSHGLEISRNPPIPVYAVADQIPDEMMIGSGDRTSGFNCEFGTNLMVEDAKPIAEGTSYFWFFGRIDYEDVFGKPHTHRFLFRYVSIGGIYRFQPYDHKHYNESF